MTTKSEQFEKLTNALSSMNPSAILIAVCFSESVALIVDEHGMEKAIGFVDALDDFDPKKFDDLDAYSGHEGAWARDYLKNGGFIDVTE